MAGGWAESANKKLEFPVRNKSFQFAGKSTIYQGLTDLSTSFSGSVSGEVLGLGIAAVCWKGVDENKQRR